MIKEHAYIDELKTKLLGGGLQFPDIENTILENNIYGVDLNEESVEIAKLSLWLRTAQPRRKLNNLSSNIKCGNSLIDDKKVAGNKAFKWETEFHSVFEKGGFDVVIGNPPYVKLEQIQTTSIALEKMEYKTFNKRADLYCVFVEKGFEILKISGIISFIMPNKWLQADYGRDLRLFLLSKNLLSLIDFGDLQVFEGATTYPLIFIGRNENPSETFKVSVLNSSTAKDFQTNVEMNFENYKTDDFNSSTWVISSSLDIKLLENIKKSCVELREFIGGDANYGIKTGLTEAFILEQNLRDSLIKKDSNNSKLIRPVLRGRDIRPYSSSKNEVYMLCTFPSLKIDIEDYPDIRNYLLKFGIERLEQSGRKGSRKKTNNKWYETQDSISYYSDFEGPKIMYQSFQVKPCFIYDEEGLYCNNSMWIIPTENKNLLGILNSKMGWWLITKYCTQIQNGVQLIWKYFGQVPIPKKLGYDLTPKVEDIISLTQTQNSTVSKFSDFFSSNYKLIKLTRKLESWYELEFGEFIKELNKAIKANNKVRNKEGHSLVLELTKKDEFEWMEIFKENKSKAQDLQTQITQTEKEIDQMVYELYGLTKEEIEIVENS